MVHSTPDRDPVITDRIRDATIYREKNAASFLHSENLSNHGSAGCGQKAVTETVQSPHDDEEEKFCAQKPQRLR